MSPRSPGNACAVFLSHIRTRLSALREVPPAAGRRLREGMPGLRPEWAHKASRLSPEPRSDARRLPRFQRTLSFLGMKPRLEGGRRAVFDAFRDHRNEAGVGWNDGFRVSDGLAPTSAGGGYVSSCGMICEPISAWHSPSVAAPSTMNGTAPGCCSHCPTR